MKHLVLILTVAILAGTALAQVTAADYGAWRRAEQASYANNSLTAYQAWRVAERASYQQLDQAAIQAWLGGFSRQEFDAARRILPDVAYWSGNDPQLGGFSRQEFDAARRILPDVAHWSGNDAVYQAQRVPEQIARTSSGMWFTEGEPNSLAVAAQPQGSIILRGVADPSFMIAPAQATEAGQVSLPRKNEWFEP